MANTPLLKKEESKRYARGKKKGARKYELSHPKNKNPFLKSKSEIRAGERSEHKERTNQKACDHKNIHEQKHAKQTQKSIE